MDAKLKQLERAYKHGKALHPLTRGELATWPDEPLPFAFHRDTRWLYEWRQCGWGGAAALRAALSFSNEELIAAYRRIWFRTPYCLLDKPGVTGRIERDFPVNPLELEIMAHFLAGYPMPSVDRVTVLMDSIGRPRPDLTWEDVHPQG